MELHEKRRGIYVAIAIVLLVGGFLLRNVEWQGSTSLHTLMELAATLLAFFVGAMALVRFFSRRDALFLYIGTGFLGTAMLDGYHAVVTSVYFQPYMPSDNPHLVPWSWIASRLFLSVLMFVSWLLWFRHRNDASLRPNTAIVMVGAAVATIASFLFFATVPLPAISIEGAIVARPVELLPAIFFFAALIGYLNKGGWRDDQFEHWLVLSLIVGVATQTVFMPFSEHLYDAEFNLAHLLKKLSYILVLIGLLASLYQTYKGIQSEVEKRKSGEIALRVNEERLKLATSAGNIGIWDWDTVRNILTWDESMYSLYGIRKEDFGGAYDAWIRTLHPDDRQYTDGEIQAALRGEREYAPEFRIIHPDGTVRNIKAASKTYYDPQGNPLRMVGTNIDITERKQAEEVAQAASQYSRSLIEASVDPLVTISAEGKITDVNKATEVVTGRSRAELIGTDFSDYFTEPDQARAGYQQVFLKGSVTDYPLALRHRDGHVTDVLYNASVYRDEAGKVLGVFAAARDITEHKRAEATRTQLAAIVESSNDAVIGKTPDGIITSWNKSAERIYGYAADEIIGKHITMLAPPSRHAEIREFLEKIRKEETVANYESERIRKDGGLIQVALTLSPIRDASGAITGISTIARDITERKKAEFVLRQSEEALKEAQRIAHLGSWHMDLATNQVVWSEELYKLYGFDPALPPPLYTESMKLFTPESWERLSTSIARATETGIPYELELETVNKDGGRGWMLARGELVRDARGAPVRVRGVVMDITERKKAEMELRELNNDFVTLLENSGDFIYFKDKDSRFRFCSQTMAKVTGHHSWRDMIGKHDLEVFPKDTARIYYEEELPIFREGKPLLNKTDPYYDDQGKTGWVNTNKWPVFGDDKKTVVGIFGISRDITELKEAEDKITELNDDLERRVIERTAQLEAANEELEEFSYSVSHDLRTPLRAIDGFSRILLDDYADKLDDEGKRLLNVVRNNTGRMGRLIDDMLRFARTGRVELAFSEIDMEWQAREAFAELQPAVAGGKLQLEIEHIPPVRGDSAMMHQVFVNLLSNAIKFSRARTPARIKVGGYVKGDETVYYVQDNGVGFDMQYAGKLFGVFQRLHGVTEFEGTGIGLAIVKRIITRHGGRVWAEGKLNEGATIYFALPTKEVAHG